MSERSTFPFGIPRWPVYTVLRKSGLPPHQWFGSFQYGDTSFFPSFDFDKMTWPLSERSATPSLDITSQLNQPLSTTCHHFVFSKWKTHNLRGQYGWKLTLNSVSHPHHSFSVIRDKSSFCGFSFLLSAQQDTVSCAQMGCEEEHTLYTCWVPTDFMNMCCGQSM